jgi:hypothetical protein
MLRVTRPFKVGDFIRVGELSDPYAHILALDDFSISYRVCCVLKDLEGILIARSKLYHQLLRFCTGAELK